MIILNHYSKRIIIFRSVWPATFGHSSLQSDIIFLLHNDSRKLYVHYIHTCTLVTCMHVKVYVALSRFGEAQKLPPIVICIKKIFRFDRRTLTGFRFHNGTLYGIWNFTYPWYKRLADDKRIVLTSRTVIMMWWMNSNYSSTLTVRRWA